MTSLSVQYREVSKRWFARVGKRNYGHEIENDCCAKGHESLAAAARHGAQKAEAEAVAEWTEAAEVPGTYAHKVLAESR